MERDPYDFDDMEGPVDPLSTFLDDDSDDLDEDEFEESDVWDL